jgi:hypothetical protein
MQPVSSVAVPNNPTSINRWDIVLRIFVLLAIHYSTSTAVEAQENAKNFPVGVIQGPDPAFFGSSLGSSIAPGEHSEYALKLGLADLAPEHGLIEVGIQGHGNIRV